MEELSFTTIIASKLSPDKFNRKSPRTNLNTEKSLAQQQPGTSKTVLKFEKCSSTYSNLTSDLYKHKNCATKLASRFSRKKLYECCH